MPRGIPKSGYRIRKGKKIFVGTARPELTEHRLNTPIEVEPTETDEEIAARLANRFEVLTLMTKSVCQSQTKAIIISGPPGLGKSYTVEQILKVHDPEELKTVYCKGFVRPTGLYKTLFEFSQSGNVIVFDDCDSVFLDDDSLNLLKSACDTTERRRLYWGAETRMTDGDGAYLPTSFDFNGSIIFITNYDFDDAIEAGHRLAPHFRALISRSHYISMGIHTVRDYLVRIKQVVVEGGMLEQMGFDKKDEKILVDFIFNHASDLRELTLRAVEKLSELYRSYPDRWESIARVTMFKQGLA